jgi:hypothetical protein
MGQFKLPAEDGKMRMTDWNDLKSIPSPKLMREGSELLHR